MVLVRLYYGRVCIELFFKISQETNKTKNLNEIFRAGYRLTGEVEWCQGNAR